MQLGIYKTEINVKKKKKRQKILGCRGINVYHTTYCDITCAMAAPLTPKRKLNMNIGSRIMFVASPATEAEQGGKYEHR